MKKLINKISLSALTATTILAGTLIAPASYAQKVIDISPASNEKKISPETSISGMFESPDGISVEAQSVKIYLNGKDITNESTITGNFFSYKPSNPLPSGDNVVRMEYQNNRGRKRVVKWNFFVEKPRNDIKISSITHNAIESIGAQSTFLATVKATPGVKTDILLYQDGRRTIEIPTEEVSRGVYVGTYRVRRNERGQQGIVVGRIQQSDEVIYNAAAQPFIFDNRIKSTEAPEIESETETEEVTRKTKYTLQPTITNFNNGDQVSNDSFILEGKTKPNATVDIKVSSKVSVLNGGFINVNLGSRIFFEDRVTADRNGNFTVRVPVSDSSSGTEYTVTATAFDNETTSNPVELTLTQK